MINKKYILMILNCYDYRNKALFQKRTWLPRLLPKQIPYFHIIGDKSKCPNGLYSFDHKYKILYVACEDDYLSLAKKTILAIEAINKTYNYEYIFKTDDDHYLTKKTFFQDLIITLNNKPYDYGGLTIKVGNHISKYYKVHPELPKNIALKAITYCAGAFYFLSKKACISLLKKKKEMFKRILEDYSVGYLLDPEYKKDIYHIDVKNIFISNIEAKKRIWLSRNRYNNMSTFKRMRFKKFIKR